VTGPTGTDSEQGAARHSAYNVWSETSEGFADHYADAGSFPASDNSEGADTAGRTNRTGQGHGAALSGAADTSNKAIRATAQQLEEFRIELGKSIEDLMEQEHEMPDMNMLLQGMPIQDRDRQLFSTACLTASPTSDPLPVAISSVQPQLVPW
jgi:hypothetical protein